MNLWANRTHTQRPLSIPFILVLGNGKTNILYCQANKKTTNENSLQWFQRQYLLPGEHQSNGTSKKFSRKIRQFVFIVCQNEVASCFDNYQSHPRDVERTDETTHRQCDTREWTRRKKEKQTNKRKQFAYIQLMRCKINVFVPHHVSVKNRQSLISKDTKFVTDNWWKKIERNEAERERWKYFALIKSFEYFRLIFLLSLVFLLGRNTKDHIEEKERQTLANEEEWKKILFFVD